MSNGCPKKEEWLDFLDGEATENRASVLRGHAEQCPYCARELALQRQLIADLAALGPVTPTTGDAVEAILAQLPRRQEARPRSRRSAVLGGVLVLAAAAGILLVPRFVRDRGTFNPRGGNEVSWTQKVGADMFVLGGSLVKLEAGARVESGIALVASYHNVDRTAAYLMVFGRDARGEWHWVYPGFQDPKSDPASVTLAALRTRQVLPDSVVLDDLPVGELELITLITREPLHVSQLESLPPADRTAASLRARFADARLTSVPLQVVPASGSKENP
jgi:hypothetical protein